MLILASQSPRRQELLAVAGWQFQIAPAEVDERVDLAEPPGRYVQRLAEAKARAVAEQAPPGWLILGADTAVVDGDDILGKPADHAEAIRILRRLRGRAHQVFSALALLRPDRDALLTDLCITHVPMRSYSEAEISAYVATGDPMDKAGAYAIQHHGFHPVAGLSGCYANVVGLPLCHLVRTLQKWGIQPPGDVPAACQNALGYRCPVFSAILRGAS